MDLIDKILHFFRQETRFALHQRMDLLKRELSTAWDAHKKASDARYKAIEELAEARIAHQKAIDVLRTERNALQRRLNEVA